MKNFPVFLLVFFSLPLLAQQLKVPTLSPRSEIKQEVGLTEISLSYARPSAKGRVVFGELVPYGEMWRTGANASTKLTVSEEVTIEDQTIPAGTYAIYTIPNKEEWTIIIHEKTNFRSIAGGKVKPENDAYRFTVKPIANPLKVETFTMQFTDIHTKGLSVELAWENLIVKFPITVEVDKQIATQMETLLQQPDSVSHRTYFRAAEYYLHNKKNLEQASSWIEVALDKSNKNFRYGLLKAKILAAQGNLETAIQTVQQANQWAKNAKNENYMEQTAVYLNSLQPSKKKIATIDGKTLLSKSIQYHDPQGQWPTFQAQLFFEQTRLYSDKKETSDVILDLPNSYFKSIDRRRGNIIEREVNKTVCQTTLNGSSDFSEADKEKHRLTCERAKMFRDYFSYLYGLPMKLKDTGTIIDPTVYQTQFQGKDCLSMRVTYEPSVGDDIWYFYFHPTTYALIGYRFYHVEAKNDGEYITLDEEITVQGIKIPQNRHWYYNKNKQFIGADFLVRGVAFP